MYSLTLDKHITLFGIYTDEQMDTFDRLEKEWKKSQPHYSPSQLINIFPEALDYVQRKIDNLITEREINRDKINKADFRKQPDLIREHDRYYDYIISYYQKFIPIKITGKHTDEVDIDRAKQVPITDFIKIRQGFATCPLHIDKKPSLKVYKNNTWYCFSCHTGGDVIEFIIRTHNINFLSAVKYLLR